MRGKIPHNVPSIYEPKPQSSPDYMGVKLNMLVDNNGTLKRRPGYVAVATTPDFNVIESYRMFRITEEKFFTVHRVSSNAFTVANVFANPVSFTHDYPAGTVIYNNTDSIRTPNIFYSHNVNEVLTFCPNSNAFGVYDGQSSIVGLDPTVLTGRPIKSATFLDGYVIITRPEAGKEDTNTFYYSNINDFSLATGWQNSNFATSSYKGDPIINLFSSEGEFYILNTHSLEMWQNDGASPFSRIGGGAIDLQSAQSKLPVPNIQNTYYIIDVEGRLIAFKNRQTQQVAYQAMVGFMKGVSADNICSMDTFVFEGNPYIHLALDKSIIINLLNEDFSVFSIDPSTPHQNTFSTDFIGWGSGGINSYKNGSGLIVSHLNTTYLYEYGNYTDYASGQEIPIMSSFETGWLDRGTGKNKRSDVIYMTCLNPSSSPTQPTIFVKYRDDGNLTWSTPRTMEMVQHSEQKAVFKLYKNGMYRTRQWCFYCSDDSPFEVGEIEEYYTLLSR